MALYKLSSKKIIIIITPVLSSPQCECNMQCKYLYGANDDVNRTKLRIKQTCNRKYIQRESYFTAYTIIVVELSLTLARSTWSKKGKERGASDRDNGSSTLIYCRFTVVERLKHSPATLDVTGSRPNSGDFSEIYFFESIQSPAQRDLKWSV